MYTEVDFGLSDVAMTRVFGTIHPRASDYRAVIAKLADEHKAGLPEGLFHYAKGRPITSGLAPIRFSSHPKGLRLIGIGWAGCQDVQAVAPALQKLLINASKTVVTCRVSSGSNKISLSGAPQIYHASTVVIGDYNHRHLWREWQATAKRTGTELLAIPEARAKAETKLADSLRRQLTELHDGPGDMTCVDRDTLVEVDESYWNRLTVRIVSTEAYGSVPSFGVLQSVHAKTFSNAPQGSLTLIRPVLEINARLEGRWAVGLLQSRGHGLLWRHWPEQLNQAAA